MSNPLFSKGTATTLYSSLWKAEQQYEADGKPQSAYAIVKSILHKADAEGNRGQTLSALLRAAALHQEWAPDSFFTDVAGIEARRAAETAVEARAVYASILAEIYQGNRYRTQARRLTLTSDEMKEWTTEQYDSAATANWRLSLADMEALAAARSKDWLPFVAQAANSAYFNHDLLHILWQRYRDCRTSPWNQEATDKNAVGKAVRDLYLRLNNREAALLVELDIAPTEVMPLLALKDTYADLPLCTEVCLRLLDTTADEAQKVAWCEETVRRYPRYARIAVVKNRLNELRQPQVTWKGSEVYYPGKTYTWELTAKNATAAAMTVYRIPQPFTDEDIERSKLSVAEYLRRHGTEVQRIHRPFAAAEATTTVKDTIQWTAPGVGIYAVLYGATTAEKEAKQKNVNNLYHLFRVTTLKTLTRELPQNQLEVIVVDAESGHPVPGATVELHEVQYRENKNILRGTWQTDAEGRALCTAAARSQLSVRVTTPADSYLPEESIWRGNVAFADAPESTQLHLYTDRAIYRPGQTVRVSGVVFTQQHWDAAVVAGKEYELLMRDANWKEVGRQQVTTDSMGVLAADFTLPLSGLPGYYRIQTNGGSVGFRVEEYKRPTFEVTMDEAPALQWPQDSITLTGRAVGYNGVPLRNARVTGNYLFTYPYFWFRRDDSPRQDIDTITTDDDGRFRARVPLYNVSAESLHYGLVLRLNVEVLSAAGETREGSIHVPLCTTPLRLNITMNEQQDRDRIAPPTFTLLSSTGKPVEGTISWAIYPDEENAAASVVGDAIAESPSPVVTGDAVAALPSSLRALPSGSYILRATARAGADSATAAARFILFSMADTRLPRHAKSWLYSPADTFDLDHPARLQVGSSFEDVVLYYSLVGKEGVVKNELLHLSDELRTIDIPYLPEYGDGVTAHFAFVKGGDSYIMEKTMKLTIPDRQLRYEWTTFRDRLHPGDKETWTLRLTTPVGTPATANLMATLYDASLDQLAPHAWSLLVNRYHRLRSLPWRSHDFFRLYSAYEQLYFPMKDYRAEGLAFDAFDSQWMDGLFFGRAGMYGRVGSLRRYKGNRVVTTEEVLMDPMPMMAAAALPDAAMARLETAEEDSAESEDTNGSSPEDSEDTALSPSTAALRTNFSETALFMPRLHSNPATGEVTLSFTLPESLTTWQFLGIAHTPDMLTANIHAQTIARKELMAQLYLPRFLRVGDEASVRATVQNLTDAPLSGRAILEIFDPETEKVLAKRTATFTTDPNGEATLAFPYTPVESPTLLAVRLTATASAPAARLSFTDGEQRYLPILPAKEWVTESIEIQADGEGTFTTDLTPLFNHDSPTATQRRLTVEYTTHPIWNVVQALPALREPQHDDILSLTSVFYANTLAAHIAATTPRLRDIIALWNKEAAHTAAVPAPSGAGQSPLATDEDLKAILLAETPWLREADSDAARRAQLIDLFDDNLLATRIGGTLDRLAQRQQSDGGFAWFPGMPSSELMTRLVAIELTRLRTLTDDFTTLPRETAERTNALLRKAVTYIAAENARLVAEMKKAEAKGATVNTGTLMHLHYIYITQRADLSLTTAQYADVSYLLNHLKGSVAGMSNDERALAAIVLKHARRNKEAQLYYDSMREHLTTTAAHGTFFDYPGGSFTPTAHKVIIHTAAMEAVRTFEPQSTANNSATSNATSTTVASTTNAVASVPQPSLLPGLRRWLLQQKRTQMWESSICTVDAIYALLHGEAAAADLQSTAKDRLTLNYPRRKATAPVDFIDGKTTAALGYLRHTIADGAAPRSITVERHAPGEAWGAVYAQYLTPLSDATAHATGLTVRRELSTTTPHLGDKLTTRYVITADRDYEYVRLSAPRAACAEPANQSSGYHYQGGLGYYRAVRDARTDYFFDRLPKGTYVLEETAFIDREGHYITGLTTIQCHYAPEYGGHTEAVELEVK